MLLSRLDTNRPCYAKEMRTRDHFEAGQPIVPEQSELEIEWDEERHVVFLQKVTKGEKKRQILAIIPLEAVQNMWPADE